MVVIVFVDVNATPSSVAGVVTLNSDGNSVSVLIRELVVAASVDVVGTSEVVVTTLLVVVVGLLVVAFDTSEGGSSVVVVAARLVVVIGLLVVGVLLDVGSALVVVVASLVVVVGGLLVDVGAQALQNVDSSPRPLVGCLLVGSVVVVVGALLVVVGRVAVSQLVDVDVTGVFDSRLKNTVRNVGVCDSFHGLQNT